MQYQPGYIFDGIKDIAKSEEKFRLLFEMSPDFVIFVNLDGKIIDCNQATVDAFKVKSKEELLKVNTKDIYSNPEERLLVIEELKNHGYIKNKQVKVKNSQGELLTLLGSWFFLNYGESEPVLISWHRDITEIIELQEKLAKSEKKFKSIFKIASYAKLISRISDGKIIEANSTFYAISGFTPDEIINHSSLSLNLWANPAHRDFVTSRLKKGETISNFESQLRMKNGKYITALISAEAIEIDGELYFISSVNDITDRKLAVEELKQSRLQLEETQKILLKTNEQLEQKVKERTIELEEKNVLLNKQLQEIEQLKEQLENENISLKEELISNIKFDEIITNNKTFHQIFKQIEQVAPTNANVFIFGETGTGKELIANAIHKLSKRNKGSFVKINCAAIPENLLESELFGHEKGAFTGAFQRKLGKFEIANHGTIFLDEIGEMPVVLQAKLLRVIQQGELERLGGNEIIKIDVRVISASNRNIEVEIKKGNFRNDLFFRLNVIPINLPPLRERKDDIPLLADYFMRKSCRKLNKPLLKIPAKIMNQLQNNNWLGNVRELENTIERAVILSQDKTLELFNWTNETKNKESTLFKTLDEHEKQYILKVLEKTNWRIRGEDGAAKILDIKPTTLEARMSKLNISRKIN